MAWTENKFRRKATEAALIDTIKGINLSQGFVRLAKVISLIITKDIV